MVGEERVMAKSPSRLTSKAEIMEYIACGKRLLAEYTSMGLPVLSLNGKWIAHTDNIDQFFRAITRTRLTDLQQQEEEQ